MFVWTLGKQYAWRKHKQYVMDGTPQGYDKQACISENLVSFRAMFDFRKSAPWEMHREQYEECVYWCLSVKGSDQTTIIEIRTNDRTLIQAGLQARYTDLIWCKGKVRFTL